MLGRFEITLLITLWKFLHPVLLPLLKFKFKFNHGEPQALATEIWGKICPPSDQEAIV